MTNLSGQSLGRYHLLEQLSEGGMGTVYKAFDTRLERDVAVKVIRRGAFPPEQLERVLKRFEREAKALAGLSHPNIVGVMDFGEYEGSPYLVMEYLPGGTLKQRLGQPMPWQQAVQILLPIAAALEYAHEHGIVHRDIKPSNILLTEKGQPMLSDFGIAKLLESEGTTALTATGVGVGTPEYMSPEQWNGQAGPASDQYSLGIVLYEMVTGRTPYRADTPVAILLKQASEPLPSPRQFAESLPEAIEKILLKALALKPEDRYPDMSAFAAALAGLVGGGVPAVVRAVPVSAAITEDRSTALQPGEAATNLQPLTREEVPPIGQPEIRAEKKQAPGKKPNREPRPRPAGKPRRMGRLVFVAVFLGVLAAGWLLASWQGWILPQLAYNFTRTRVKDGMEMVYVPAGTFDMGSYDGSPDEGPKHTVNLDAYYIDRTEVTVGMYSRCYQEGECAAPGQHFEHGDPAYNTIDFEDYPILNVTWQDASTYCAWAGGRLPTEAEWEKAARGTNGRTYPWGNGEVNAQRLNFADVSVFDELGWDYADTNMDDGYFTTAPVGSFPAGASPYGALDMAGNAWEWVADWYGQDYYSQSPFGNPTGPETGEWRVQRGGSWADDDWHVRTTYRGTQDPETWGEYVGFRCVMPVHTSQSTVPPASLSMTDTPDASATEAARAMSGTATYQTLSEHSTATAIARQALITATAQAERASFGNMLDQIMNDPFQDNANGWSIGPIANTYYSGYISIRDGKYLWVMERVDEGFVDYEIIGDELTSFTVSVEAQRMEGSAADTCYGLVFRYSTQGKYVLEVCDDQKYMVALKTDSWDYLEDWSASPAIQPGESNLLAIIAQGNRFGVYINGQWITTVQDSTLSSGSVGILAGTSTGVPARFEFDNFRLSVP